MGNRIVTSRRRAGGFTLLELVIAISLVGLIMVLSYSSLRMALRSWAQAEAVIADEEELRMVQGFLWRQLSQAQPSTGTATADTDHVFRGAARRMDFVAPIPGARAGVSGYYRFTLELVPAASGLNLRLAYAPDLPAADSDSQHEADRTRILVHNIEAGGFSYYGSTAAFDTPSWRADWQQNAALPQLVRVRLTPRDKTADWPDLVIPVMAQEAG